MPERASAPSGEARAGPRPPSTPREASPLPEIKLNEAQGEAVKYCDGPLQVIAGPGTGKTRVITEKVLHLIRDREFEPEKILALTFTDKAAEEMAGRIRATLGKAGIKGQPKVSTFHAFCLDLVEAHHDRLGYDAPPKLLVGPLFTQFILRHLDDLPLENTNLAGRTTTVAKNLGEFLSLCHDEALLTLDLGAAVDAWLATLNEKDREKALEVRDLAASVPVLLQLQAREGIVTYGDLLTQAVRLLRGHPEAREEIQRQFDHVLVDEFQDNNRAQMDLVNLLVEPHGRVLVVGDDDQSIYRFRGARMNLMEEFRAHWGDKLKITPLTENYRSTEAIIEAGQALIRHNAQRFGEEKTLRMADGSKATGPGEVTLLQFDTEETERRAIVNQILDRVNNGTKPGDIALLFRSLNHTHDLVREMSRQGLAVEVVGGGGLFRNPVVRELLAWLKTLDDPSGDEAALHRVLRLQSFGLKHQDLRLLGAGAKEQKVPLITIIEQLEADEAAVDGLSKGAVQKLRGFLAAYRRFQEELEADGRPDVSGLILELVKDTGLQHRLRPVKPQGRQNLSAFGGLLQAAKNYEEHYPYPSLHGFVRHLDLLEEIGHDETLEEPSDDEETIKVMTVHKAKGREFPVVFVPGFSRHFPGQKGRSGSRKFLDHLTLDMDYDKAHEEEERRTLYVALTRAQSHLILSVHDAKEGGKQVKHSSYLDEVATCPKVDHARVTAADVPEAPEAPVELKTREAVENRLHYLLSKLGAHAEHQSAEEALKEVLPLVAGLIAEGVPGGPQEVEATLQKMGLLPKTEKKYLEPDPPGGVTGPLFLSASSLNMYRDCPRQYFYRHIARIPETAEKDAATRGTAIHAVLEDYYRRHRRADPSKIGEIEARLRKEAGAIPFRAKKEREQWVANTVDVIRHYLQEEAGTGAKCLDVEREFVLTVEEDVTIHGFMDRVDEMPDGRVRVTDYKSGGTKSRPYYLEESLQMPLYAWAVQEAIGRELAAVEVVGLRELKDLKRGVEVDRQVLPWEDGSKYALTGDLIEGVKRRVKEVVEGVRRGEFEPVSEEKRCGWCHYRLVCEGAWGDES